MEVGWCVWIGVQVYVQFVIGEVVVLYGGLVYEEVLVLVVVIDVDIGFWVFFQCYLQCVIGYGQFFQVVDVFVQG